MNAAFISPAPRGAWRELLGADPKRIVSQSPEWVDAMAASGDYEDASRLYEIGKRRFVLPMVRRNRVFGAFATEASFPEAWGIGGLVGPGADLDTISTVFRSLRSEGSLQVSIRPNPLDGYIWAAAAPAEAIALPRSAHVIELEADSGPVWKRISDPRKRGVRKAERSGVEIECDATGRLVPTFYNLFNRSIERWARQQGEPRLMASWRARRRDPLDKLQALAERLGEAFKVWVASKDGEPLASIIVLQDGNAHYTRGAMDKDLAARLRANDLLQWRAIQDACEHGCRHYHMGDSAPSGSLASFKETFGARPLQYATYRLERFPITRIDRMAREAAKRVIGFRDV